MISFYQIAGVIVFYLLVARKEIKSSNKATVFAIWTLLGLSVIAYFLMKVSGDYARPVDILQKLLGAIIPFR